MRSVVFYPDLFCLSLSFGLRVFSTALISRAAPIKDVIVSWRCAAVPEVFHVDRCDARTPHEIGAEKQGGASR